MSTSTGPSRNRCSITPRISSDRSSSFVRTSPIDSGGHRSSSIEPPSPRVAVTSTTRWPLRTAVAISPADKKMSSSGCAQIPRIVPSAAVSCIKPPVRSRGGKHAPGGAGRHPCAHPPSHAAACALRLSDDRADPVAERLGHVLLDAARRDDLLQVLAELRAVQTRRTAGQVVGDARCEVRIHLAVEVRLDLEEGLGTVGSTLTFTHRRVLAPWPSPTTPSRALSFPGADGS